MHKQVFSLLVSFIIMICSACSPSPSETHQEPDVQEPLYTVFLNKPVPQGTTVSFNAPVLRWPVKKGKAVKYDVRISDDPTFEKERSFGEEGISWAMYNPHRALKPGDWYWQYRTSGADWSDTFKFTVTADALPMVSPAATVFLKGIPVAHPRILTGRRTAAELKSLADNADARAVIAEAELQWLKPVPKEASVSFVKKGKDKDRDRKREQDAVNTLGNAVHNMVVSLSRAYLLTGDEKYVPKLMEVLMEVASWDPKGLSHEQDFADARCMRAMAIGYDTFYDRLTPEQREKLRTAIKARASHFYDSWVNVQEAKVLSGHLWQHILHYFFESAIAVYETDDAEAGQWLTYAYELFLARAPVLGDLDGGWAEGTSYFRMNMETLIEMPVMIRMYTGFDFIKTHPWYKNQVNWLIYNVTPGSFSDGYGDNNETVNNQLFYHYNKTGGDNKQAAKTPITSYMAFAQELGKLLQDPKATWYVNSCERHEGANLASEPMLRWFRLTRTHDVQLPADTGNLQFPMANLATGVTAMHTNLTHTPEDLAVFMRSSAFGAYGHILADQNTFNILYGGSRLFYRTGFKISMNDPHRTGWYQQTKSANGILINGQGQPISIEAGGRITRFMQGNNIAYTKGDASNAYRSEQTKEDFGVKKFYRHVLLLKPDIVVIYDELEADKAVNWSWLIHSINEMIVDSTGNSFSTSLGNVKGVGKLWAPASMSWSVSDTFPVPVVNWRHPGNKEVDEDYSQQQWHVTATNSAKLDRIRFLTIIKVGENADMHQLRETSDSSGSISVTAGDWIIEASLADNMAPSLSVYSPSRKTSFSAYGNQLKAGGIVFTGKLTNSSKLAEFRDGEMKFEEAGDRKRESLR